MIGHRAVGKTKAAKKACKRLGLKVVKVKLLVLNEGDMIGLPVPPKAR